MSTAAWLVQSRIFVERSWKWAHSTRDGRKPEVLAKYILLRDAMCEGLSGRVLMEGISCLCSSAFCDLAVLCFFGRGRG